MQTFKVTYRPEAVRDLEEIYDHIYRLSVSPDIAAGFVGRIQARCQRIGKLPLGGVARDDLAPGIRIAPFERTAVIAYRVLADRVQIVNVFYGGRDYEALYRDHGVPEDPEPDQS